MSAQSVGPRDSKNDNKLNRLPPGQFLTHKLPVMTLSSSPIIVAEDWRLMVTGLDGENTVLTWIDFMSLPQVLVVADFHCVTQWSKLDVIWDGVLAKDILDLCKINYQAGYAMINSYDGYTTNIDLTVLADSDSLFAHSYCGAPLTLEHGGPVRLVVPKRYGWKSAKWVCGLNGMSLDSPGFWEGRGYHMRGNPWTEERFGFES